MSPTATTAAPSSSSVTPLKPCCTLALMRFALHPNGRVWPIYAVLFGVGTGRAFSSPASSAFLPSLIPKHHFVNAVTWGAIVFQIANIAGPRWAACSSPCASPGCSRAGTARAVVYAFSLLTLLAFLVLVGMMRTRPMRVVKNAFNLETMLAGFRYVVRAKLLLGSISLDLFAVLLGGATALMPIFATDILHARPPRPGSAAGHARLGRAGRIAGHDGAPVQRNAGMIGCSSASALYGAATVIFGLSHIIWVSLLALVLVGASDMVSVVIRASMLQLATPPGMRGRVSAVNGLFIGASNEIGGFESGLTALVVGRSPRRGRRAALARLVVTVLADAPSSPPFATPMSSPPNR